MTRLTIDEREVDVPPGSTILDAARKLGLDIPTLCFLEGYRPSTSCQVCMVRIRGGRLVPSCATQVAEGMAIESETPEVHHLRRTALELLLSDHVGDCHAPCFFACPAHMDVPKMLREIGSEDLQHAIATIKEDIALPAVLGRVCPKPCEKGCRRSDADGPVEVCDLKRFVADEDLASDSPYVPVCKPDSGKRVAVVGAGPAGLAGAYHLRVDGHQVTLIDAESQPGGRLRREFSEQELPPKTLEAEVGVILRLGIEYRRQTRLGRDVSLAELRDQYDAVLLACGAIEKAEVVQWGLKPATRGIDVHKGTYETSLPHVFAAGNALRGKGLVVRSVADGKESAHAISQHLAGKPIVPVHRPFSSRITHLHEDDMSEFLSGAASLPRLDSTSDTAEPLSLPIASQQSHRCFACGCAAQGNCRLERYAAQYGAEPGKYHDGRRAFVQVNRNGSVIYEPGKCINCELCIQIATQAQSALGLSFVGRGFDVRVGVPFQGSLEEGLGEVAARCVAACPTGALFFARVGTKQGCGSGAAGSCGCGH